MSEPIETTKLDSLTPDIKNANRGTERGAGMLEKSLHKLGAGRSILLDKNGRIIAGNKTAEAAMSIGLEDVVIVRTTGDKLVAVLREDLDLTDDTGTARQLAYADNRVGAVSLDFDPDVIAGDLSMGLDLSDWFHDWELEDLEITPPSDFVADIDKEAKPNPRKLPIDVIYTLQMADCTCCLAVQAGLLYGIQSAHYRICPYTGHLSERHKIFFVDNDYFDYDHKKHLEAIVQIRPKYATVMDVMTRSQCAKDKIKHHELSQILDWAEELNEYAENVIVIPKYDCIDKIPEKFMLGYSVPTSHGGTPLPPEAFKGRRVHLLGGSWKAQLNYMAILRDDVISLDNNYIQLQANYGSFVYPDGKDGNLSSDLGLNPNNPRYTALSISFGNIGAKVNELYKKEEDAQNEGQ